MAEQTFSELWALYMGGSDVTPAEWVARGRGWDMARILGDLRAEGLTGPAMMEAANGIAAGLEELGFLYTPADIETVTLSVGHAASSYNVPVLLIDGGLTAYGPGDMTPAGVIGAELVRTWGARFTGQAADGDLRGLLLDLWAGAMIGPDGAGFVKVSPELTARVVAMIRAGQ